MAAAAVVAAGGAAALFAGGATRAEAGVIKVFKSPTCGCCANWVTYLERAGWRVDVDDRADVAPIKRQAGVPYGLAGCHTAFVEGYVVEGHVPLPAIDKLLAERPDLSGIAVPGMPADAPGMRGGGILDVVGFRAGEATGLYMRARG